MSGGWDAKDETASTCSSGSGPTAVLGKRAAEDGEDQETEAGAAVEGVGGSSTASQSKEPPTCAVCRFLKVRCSKSRPCTR
jgi:hypothetical protein